MALILNENHVFNQGVIASQSWAKSDGICWGICKRISMEYISDVLADENNDVGTRCFQNAVAKITQNSPDNATSEFAMSSAKLHAEEIQDNNFLNNDLRQDMKEIVVLITKMVFRNLNIDLTDSSTYDIAPNLAIDQLDRVMKLIYERSDGSDAEDQIKLFLQYIESELIQAINQHGVVKGLQEYVLPQYGPYGAFSDIEDDILMLRQFTPSLAHINIDFVQPGEPSGSHAILLHLFPEVGIDCIFDPNIGLLESIGSTRSKRYNTIF